MSQFSVRHHQLDQAGNPKPLESLLPLWPIQNQLWTHNCTIPNTDCTVSRLKWGQTDLSTIIYTISKFQLRSHNFDQYHTVASRPELREVTTEWATVTMLHYFPHVCICICIVFVFVLEVMEGMCAQWSYHWLARVTWMTPSYRTGIVC